MKRMNLGCGPDIKKGWTNTDNALIEGVEIWDAREPNMLYRDYDFILVNHVLCTMIPSDVDKVLKNCYDALKPGGKIQVIDMDVIKAFSGYILKDREYFPIAEGDLDYKFCMHVSGYGTRLSLFTAQHLSSVLGGAHFVLTKKLKSSKYDLRPGESLILEAVK